MEIYEELVMNYLTKDEEVFINPQYSIKDNSGTQWSCPDFVALDFREREVQIVEVTTSYNITRLAQKINDRNNQWIRRLKQQLRNDNIIDETWKFVVKAFVRKDVIENIKKKVVDQQDVVFKELEDIFCSWDWDWDRNKNKSNRDGS